MLPSTVRLCRGPRSETRGRGVTGSTEAFVTGRDTAFFFQPHRARLGVGVIHRIVLTPPAC